MSPTPSRAGSELHSSDQFARAVRVGYLRRKLTNVPGSLSSCNARLYHTKARRSATPRTSSRQGLPPAALVAAQLLRLLLLVRPTQRGSQTLRTAGHPRLPEVDDRAPRPGWARCSLSRASARTRTGQCRLRFRIACSIRISFTMLTRSGGRSRPGLRPRAISRRGRMPGAKESCST